MYENWIITKMAAIGCENRKSENRPKSPKKLFKIHVFRLK